MKKTYYAKVHNLDQEEGLEEFKIRASDDRTTSLVRWVSIQRSGIELEPGGTAELPLEINIAHDAKPGVYYGSISFTENPNLPEAEEVIAARDRRQTLIVLELREDVKERAQVNGFSVEKSTYFESPIVFHVEIQNVGNIDLPLDRGISIYNKSGERLDLLEFEDGSVLEKDQTFEYTFSWDNASTFGEYKAFLDVVYGSDERSLQDTLYFRYVPKHIALLVILAFGGAVLCLLLWSIFGHYRHHEKLSELEQSQTGGRAKFRSIPIHENHDVVIDIRAPKHPNK